MLKWRNVERAELDMRWLTLFGDLRCSPISANRYAWMHASFRMLPRDARVRGIQDPRERSHALRDSGQGRPHARNVAAVLVNDKPNVRCGRNRRRLQAAKACFHIGAKTGQTGQTAPRTRGGKQGLMTARLQSQTGAQGKFRYPGRLSILLSVAEQRHQPVSGAACLEVGLAVTLEVSRRGIKSKRNPTQSPHNKIVLAGRSEPHCDVGFPHR